MKIKESEIRKMIGELGKKTGVTCNLDASFEEGKTAWTLWLLDGGTSKSFYRNSFPRIQAVYQDLMDGGTPSQYEGFPLPEEDIPF